MNSIYNKSKAIRNIILVSFDSLRSDYIDKAGSNETPNICHIRDNGAFFRNTIVQAPLTVPSHVSMLSGQYPANTGVRDMHHMPSPKLPTLITILKEKGFITLFSSPINVLSGKILNGIDQQVPFRRKKLFNAISKLNDKSFFIFFHYWGTHTPYNMYLPSYKPKDILINALKPLERFNDVYIFRRILRTSWFLRVSRIRAMMKEDSRRTLPAIKKGYKKAIIKADKFIGELLRILQANNMADKTLLVVTGDHGDSFNEHDEINRATGKRYEHGQFLYDDIIKVPTIFFSPEKNLSRVFDSQIQQIDIVPTCLESLGIEYEMDLDGKSLWNNSIIKGQEPEESFSYSEVVRESLDKELRCVRSMTSKLIYDYKNNIFELYNLRTDPEEKKNLWPGDGYSEKEVLKAKLQLFSKIKSSTKTSSSEHEEQQIRKKLRALGYID